jgi:hypothetical protein
MINTFILKKYGALLMCGMVTTIGFFIGLQFLGFLWAMGTMGLGLAISVLLANTMLKNPFSSMLEGAGVLAINIDSTGILNPFIMSVKSPYIEGVLNGTLRSDVFDREAVFNLAAPHKAGIVQQGIGSDGKVRIALILSEEDYNKGRFAMFHYPVILFNEQLNSIITKDWFSDQEKQGFAEHQVLYLNRKMEELTSVVRDFARYVVESLKPNKPFEIKPIWIIILIAVVIIILLVVFGPSILPTLKGAAGSVTQGIGTVTGSVSPLPK